MAGTTAPAARDTWVDLAKGIGILLVVYGHVARGLYNAHIPMDEGLYQAVDAAIYSFHMPLFFFLSGLFFLGSLRKRGAGRLVLNKVDTIVYPYLLWSILQGCVEALLSRWTNGQVTFREVFSLLWLPRAHFWFLYALFWICVLGALVYAVRAAGRQLPWLVALAALGVFAARPWLPDVPNLGYVTTYFVYFAAGVCFRDVQALAQRHGAWLLVPLALGFAAAQYAFHTQNVAGREVGEAARLGLALLGIALVVLASQQLARWRLPWLAALGQASMAIYLVHVLAGSGARIVLAKFLHTDNPAVHLAVGCAVAIGVPMLLLHLARRWGGMFLFENPWPLERVGRAR